MGNDVDKDSTPCLKLLRPSVLESAIGAAIEAGVLGEMIEGVARAVETGSNKVTAIVSGTPIRAARFGL